MEQQQATRLSRIRRIEVMATEREQAFRNRNQEYSKLLLGFVLKVQQQHIPQIYKHINMLGSEVGRQNCNDRQRELFLDRYHAGLYSSHSNECIKL
jgi:hypothetical protein